jgi:hypothetical protein
MQSTAYGGKVENIGEWKKRARLKITSYLLHYTHGEADGFATSYQPFITAVCYMLLLQQLYRKL